MLDKEWMSLRMAYDHVLSLLIAPHTTKRKILEALASEKIPAKAQRIVRRYSPPIEDPPPAEKDVFLSETFWLDNTDRIDWYYSRWQNYYKDVKNFGHDVLVAIEVENITLHREHVLSLWPLRKGGGNPKAHKDPRGTKSSYEWDAIFIHSAEYLYRLNGNLGTKAALYEIVRDFVDDPQGGPGDTQLKDRIGPLFDAFKRINDGRKN